MSTNHNSTTITSPASAATATAEATSAIGSSSGSSVPDSLQIDAISPAQLAGIICGSMFAAILIFSFCLCFWRGKSRKSLSVNDSSLQGGQKLAELTNKDKYGSLAVVHSVPSRSFSGPMLASTRSFRPLSSSPLRNDNFSSSVEPDFLSQSFSTISTPSQGFLLHALSHESPRASVMGKGVVS
jgi:hypothetical protein